MVQAEGQTPVPGRKGAYRSLFANAKWRRYTLTTGFQRVSVAMAPVALVLAGHAAVGSFQTGALMASTYTFADGIASPLSGRLLDRMELRRGVTVELGATTVILLGLAGLAAIRAPALALIVLSGLAGVAPAGVMGGLRAYLQRIVPDDLLERAFALDATLLELEWMIAPAGVAIVGFLGAPVLAIVLMAVATLGALGGARTLGRQPPSKRVAGISGAWRLRKAMPTYFLNTIMGYSEGTINIALAPLMVIIGSRPATAALLITLLSATSAVGGVGYSILEGRRSGNTEQRANIALLALGLGVLLIAMAPSLSFVTLAIAICGLWFAPIVAMRSVILGRLLPESQLSEGFSTLSAAGQFGYGMSGVATGIVLGFAGARACFFLAAAVAIISSSAAWLRHRFSSGHSRPLPESADSRP